MTPRSARKRCRELNLKESIRLAWKTIDGIKVDIGGMWERMNKLEMIIGCALPELIQAAQMKGKKQRSRRKWTGSKYQTV